MNLVVNNLILFLKVNIKTKLQKKVDQIKITSIKKSIKKTLVVLIIEILTIKNA